MGNSRVRIKQPQMIQNYLVSDFPWLTNVLGQHHLAPKTESTRKSAVALRSSLTDARLFRSMLIEADKLAQRYGKAGIFRSAERV
jgi:hypothetical protein